MIFLKRLLATFFPLTRKELTNAGIVFVVYFITAKLSLLLYYTFQTSPALIWPPVGLAIVAVFFGGYRMWFPIFLAQHLSLITTRTGVDFISLIISVSYALQAIVALFIMHRLKLQAGNFNLRNTLIILGVALGVTTIEPAILAVAQGYLGTLSVSPLISFARAWGGGLFSALILVPIGLGWRSWRHWIPEKRAERIETMIAIAFLVSVNYLIFWTTYPRYFGISVIFFIPAVFIWFALRLHPRWMSFGLLITSIQGITGAIFAMTGAAISQQLLNIEVYVGFVAAIFLVFAAVVHERRVAYARLAEAYQETFASDRGKNEFIAILAHELRNPLAPIVSSLDLLRLQSKDPELLQTVKGIEDNVLMMRRLLDDLLDAARISQRKFELKKELFDLRDVLRTSVAAVEGFAKSRRHTLTLSLPSESIMIHGDPIRIRQIVMNLLNNACKYTEPGGKIEIHAEKRDNHGLIEVSDTGIGIDPSSIPQLFQPFKQMRQTMQQGTGLGIGLYLTKRLTEMHDGKIVVESRGVGTGSRFLVYLPLHAEEVAAQTEKKREMEHATGSRVLIVDDNKAAADTLQKLLRHYKHTVEVVYSGEKVFEKLKEFMPDLILLDLGMPGMDGYEVAKKLRSGGWKGVLAALSGYGQEEDRKKTREHGFDHHFVKPVRTEDILAVLASLKSSA